jgi:hypothetical protein
LHSAAGQTFMNIPNKNKKEVIVFTSSLLIDHLVNELVKCPGVRISREEVEKFASDKKYKELEQVYFAFEESRQFMRITEGLYTSEKLKGLGDRKTNIIGELRRMQRLFEKAILSEVSN